MRKISLVARREIRLQFRSKGFLITVVSGVVLIFGLIVVPALLAPEGEYTVAVVGDAALVPALEASAERGGRDLQIRSDLDESVARAAIGDGDLDIAVVDNRTILSEGQPDESLLALIQQAHEAVTIDARIGESALPADEVRTLISVEPLVSETLDVDAEDGAARQFVALMVLVLLLFLLMSTAVSVASGVAEEKSSKIVEILLVSIRARELLTGKLIAFGALGLVQLVAFALAAFAALSVSGLVDDLPPGMPGVVASTFTGYIFGFLFFGAMAAALAARIARQEDLNSTLGPMTAVMVFTYLGAFLTLASPDSAFSRVVTLLPPFSSMVLPVRLSTGSVPVWEVAVSTVLMLVAVVAIMLAAGRIYERSVLRTGSKGRITDALRHRRDDDVLAPAGATVGGHR